MDEVVYNLRMMTGYRHQKERRGVMAHTFLQEITGCLLLSFFLTTSFKCKFVLIPLDFQAFLFFFFNPKERLTGGYFGSSQHMTPTMSLLSLSDTGRTVSTSVSLLEQKLHKYSDVWSPFSLMHPQHWEQRLIHTSHLVTMCWMNRWLIVVLLLSHVWLFATPWTAALQASLSIGSYSNSCALSQRCHPPISSSVVLLLLPSFSASVLPMNIQDWFPLTGWILQSKGLSRVFSNTSSKASILWCLAFFIVQLSHPYMTTGKIIALTRRTFGGKVMSLLFNRLSKLVITFLPRSKHLLISLS